MPRTLLMISYYYPPLGGIGAQRSLKLARYLPRFGWRAIVVTPSVGSYALDPSLDEIGEVIRTRSWELPRLLRSVAGRLGPGAVPGAAAEPADSPQIEGHRGLRKLVRTWLYIPDPCVGWLPFARRAAFAAAARADAVFSTSSPATAHLAARAVARRRSLPWIADYRDLWTDAHYPFYDSPLRLAIDRRLEGRVLADAQAVTTVSRPWRDTLARGQRDPERFRVIPNGFDPDDFAALSPPRRRPGAPSPEHPFVLLYAGLFYGRRQDPDPLFRALARLFEAGRLARDRVRVRIYGAADPYVVDRVDRLGLGDVVQNLGFRPHAETLAAQREADALWLIVRDDPRSLGHVPGKLFEYIGAGRPILAQASERGEVARIVADSEAGVVVAPDDSPGLDAALLRLYRDEIAPASPEARLDHSRERVAGRFAELLDSMIGERRHLPAPIR